jgi:cystathionine beta-lyase/cystathionine gamma-synthase
MRSSGFDARRYRSLYPSITHGQIRHVRDQIYPRCLNLALDPISAAQTFSHGLQRLDIACSVGGVVSVMLGSSLPDSYFPVSSRLEILFPACTLGGKRYWIVTASMFQRDM